MSKLRVLFPAWALDPVNWARLKTLYSLSLERLISSWPILTMSLRSMSRGPSS